MNATQSQSPAQRLMQESREDYEQYVLAALNTNETLWGQMLPFLCVTPDGKRRVNDFEHPLHYSLFLALKEYRQLMKEGKQPFSPATDIGMTSFLQMLTMEVTPVIVEEQIDEALAIWRGINTHITEADALAIVSSTWQEWLQSKKAQHTAKHITRTDGTDAKLQLELLARTQQSIAGATEEHGFETLDGLLDNPEAVAVERFPMAPRTWGILNESLGGGFGKGEHTLVIAPSGGGKTVFACQVAIEMAYSGKNVLYISTEEGMGRLAPRWISCISYNTKTKIMYSSIRGKPNFAAYLPDHYMKFIRTVSDQIKQHLLFKDWTGGLQDGAKTRKYNVEDISTEVERAMARLGAIGEKLDIVILDWLGATLRAGVTDTGALRLIYSNAATLMKEIAIKYDIATISLAQASPDASKKVKIDNTCIAECRSLHNEAHAAIGISHLANAADEGGSARNSYKELQCFNVFKSRGGTPQTFWMKENFDYQRFDSP